MTDKLTGEPVRASVFYSVFEDNPHYQGAPGLNGAFRGWIDSYYIADDGKFRRVGLPRRGLISVRAMDNRSLMGVGADEIGGEKGRFGQPDNISFRTAPTMVLSMDRHTLVEINVPPDATVHRCDVTVDPGRTVNGTVADTNGKPLAGVLFCGEN